MTTTQEANLRKATDFYDENRALMDDLLDQMIVVARVATGDRAMRFAGLTVGLRNDPEKAAAFAALAIMRLAESEAAVKS